MSDTLSGLDARVKRQSCDPDDDATLTEMMKKRKMFEDKKTELDAQAAAALAEKKYKFQKESTAAPLESEIELGVFSEKTGNRLEKIFKSASPPPLPEGAFNADKKGLLWRVADAEEKLAKEKQYNVDCQKEWENACERSNRELKAALDEIVKLKGEETKQSDEHEQAVAVYQKGENEYTHRLANLEKLLLKRQPGAKLQRFWLKRLALIASGYLRAIVDRIVKSDELVKYMFELGEAAYNSGRKDGYGEGRVAAAAKEKDYHFELYKEDSTAAYATKRQEYEFLEFAIVRPVEKLSRKGGDVETPKKALGNQDPETEGAGPSHQV
ncbi:hypothetical protein Hdeb2414_s0020g00554801 [Helianthus debilis subsp. tardiflorus]